MSVIQTRARALRVIREYFHSQQVTEVDTPLLGEYTVTDPYMSSLEVSNTQGKKLGYLQTSPEYAMKKLLARGCGDIYQLSKVFRSEEYGRHHRQEFTLLEWYRVGWDHFQLMAEVHQLIELICGQREQVLMTYESAFSHYLGLELSHLSEQDLADFAAKKLGELPDKMLFDNYLTLLFASLIEPQFDPERLTFIYDFPASQASLAKVVERHGKPVACRFEAYTNGLELANGFWELTDPKEQQLRFLQDNQVRQSLGYPKVDIDHRFIQALESGIPECSGVALGFDRLLMAAENTSDIANILPAI